MIVDESLPVSCEKGYEGPANGESIVTKVARVLLRDRATDNTTEIAKDILE